MMMKRFFLFLTFLCYIIGVLAENTITLSNVQGTIGSEVKVSISMKNTDAVSAIQLSIPINENMTFVDNSQKAGARLGGHSLSAGVKDGILNIMVYSNTMAAINGNDGELLSFKLLLGNNPGTIELNLSKTSITGTNGNSLMASVTSGTIDVRGARIRFNGSSVDFNNVPIGNSTARSIWINNVGNESLVISNIVFSNPVFSLESTTDFPITVEANNSSWFYVNCLPTTIGALDEEMTIISNAMPKETNIRLLAKPYTINELQLSNVSGTSGEEVTVSLNMKNMNTVSGFQMDIKIPKELEYVDNSFVLSNRKQDHVVSAVVKDDTLHIVTYSPTDKSFSGSDGQIGSFKIKIVGSSDSSLDICKAMMSATVDGKTIDVLSGKNGGRVSIKSPRIYTYRNLNVGNFSIKEQNVQRSFYIDNRGDAQLVISKIVFANGFFSIKEDLPLIIEPSKTKSITIVCEAREAGDVETTMEIYSNDPDQRLYSVDVTGRVFAPNYLAPTVHEASTNKVVMKISMDNYDEIMGMEFDLTSADGFSVEESSIQLASRTQGMVVSSSHTGENKLHIFAYMMTDGISKGDGELMKIGLTPTQALSDGSHSLTINNIVLGTKDMVNRYAGEESLTMYFEVPTAAPEDANVVVTAKSYTREYGDDNPVFGYTSSGETLTGKPEISCMATTTSPVGVYPIVIKKGNIGNSSVSFINGTLTITKAPLTIKAGTYSKMVGEDNPFFTMEYEGFKNGDTEAALTKQPMAICNATKVSAVGDYSVRVSGAKSLNYDISYVNGILIIETCLGDANGDGVVNAADIVAIISHINGKTPTGFVQKAADVNKDQQINETDVKAIASIIMK